MPELEPPLVNRARVPGSAGRWQGAGRLRLERLSPREATRADPLFGVDTPYYATPTGWGEWLPVLPGETADFIVAIAPPSAVVEAEVASREAMEAEAEAAEEGEAITLAAEAAVEEEAEAGAEGQAEREEEEQRVIEEEEREREEEAEG